MEIVCNPTVMDISHTIALAVLTAVITLLWRVALSGAEIAKARRMQALPATHNSACAEERSDGYQWLKSVIYGHSFQVEMGNTMRRQSWCIQREKKRDISMEIKEHWLSQSRALLKVLQCFVQKDESLEKKAQR